MMMMDKLRIEQIERINVLNYYNKICCYNK